MPTGRFGDRKTCKVPTGLAGPVHCVFNKTKESFLGFNITRADTWLSRLRGLLGKLRLPPGEGMWFVPSQGVHTLGMVFPIDVVYLDAENRVIHLVENLKPFRFSPIRLKCVSILELPPRTIRGSRTRQGDCLVICPPDEMVTGNEFQAANTRE